LHYKRCSCRINFLGDSKNRQRSHPRSSNPLSSACWFSLVFLGDHFRPGLAAQITILEVFQAKSCLAEIAAGDSVLTECTALEKESLSKAIRDHRYYGVRRCADALS